jgi:hypothetical protein
MTPNAPAQADQLSTASARLMAIAFEFQTLLLARVHGIAETVETTYTTAQAEALADEIQALSHFIEEDEA